MPRSKLAVKRDRFRASLGPLGEVLGRISDGLRARKQTRKERETTDLLLWERDMRDLLNRSK